MMINKEANREIVHAIIFRSLHCVKLLTQKNRLPLGSGFLYYND